MRCRVATGLNTKGAAASAFRFLLLPGGVALLSDTVGFLTLLAIDIGIIRELAISASLGVGVIILTNLVLLPLLISYIHLEPKTKNQISVLSEKTIVWRYLSNFATDRYATAILIVSGALYAVGLTQANKIQIGDLQAGAPALHQHSRYNLDTAFITDNFSITTDVITVIVEAFPEACTYHQVLSQIDKFQWLAENTSRLVPVSLASVAKKVNAGFNEGSPKWQVLPRTQLVWCKQLSGCQPHLDY